jgi:hypothetical protein
MVSDCRYHTITRKPISADVSVVDVDTLGLFLKICKKRSSAPLIAIVSIVGGLLLQQRETQKKVDAGSATSYLQMGARWIWMSRIFLVLKVLSNEN